MIGRIESIHVQEGYGRIEQACRPPKHYTFYARSWEGLEVDATVDFELKTSKAGIPYAVNVTPRTERNRSKFNTEDKQKWCREGERLEVEFVKNIVPLTGRHIIVNPAKEESPYVIDLYDLDTGRYADLKSQNTPFFTAAAVDRRYHPRYTVTFNHKDYQRYAQLYPDCDIYFCVNWTQTDYQDMHIQPLEGVWVARFADMRALIEGGRVPLHAYKYRKDDAVNAKDSYLFDLRSDIFSRLI